MNATTSAKTLLATSILTLGLGFASLCAADEPQVTVSYRDLAVATPQGAAALYKRISFAADQVCSYLFHGDLASKAHKNACMDKAIATAVMHVGEPQLFSVYNSNHSMQLPVSLPSNTVASR
jgi:UrcA family protein